MWRRQTDLAERPSNLHLPLEVLKHGLGPAHALARIAPTTANSAVAAAAAAAA